MTNIRNYFPGANSYKGFYSYFNNILMPSTDNKKICIKGGPGTGKSTFMKKVGKDFNDKGYSVEYHHCSSDSESLDGVVIKELNISIIDATAPHMTDPIYPGVVDSIFNIGDFWNESLLKEKKDLICPLSDEISFNFKKFYNILGASKLILDNVKILNQSSICKSKLISLANSLSSEIFNTSIGIHGNARDLFITAIAPLGIVSYTKELIDLCENVYHINGSIGSGKNFIMKFLINQALSKGYNVEIYHNPLVPKIIEHIYIPDLSTAIITSSDLIKSNYSGKEFLLSEIQNQERVKEISEDIYHNKCEFDCLIKFSLELLSKNKKLHDDLETYYIEAMDFEKLDNSYKTIYKTFSL